MGRVAEKVLAGREAGLVYFDVPVSDADPEEEVYGRKDVVALLRGALSTVERGESCSPRVSRAE